jgi:hypothetical protein
MKKVIFTKNLISFEEMLEKHKYIGFIPKNSKRMRYMIIVYGEYKGLAVSGNSCWNLRENQPNARGQYFHFPDRVSLLEWVINSNEPMHETNNEIYLESRESYLTKGKEEIIINSFEKMIKDYDFIGFIPKFQNTYKKYIILTYGDYRGLAVRFNNHWTTVEEQKNTKGDYFIFETLEKLKEWFLK